MRMIQHHRWAIEVGLVLWCVSSAAAATDYAGTILEHNPVAYWRLGDSSGAAATDASGNGLNGAYNGGVTLGQPGALVGDADTAVTFNGGYVEVPHDNRMLLNNGTVMFWVNNAGGGSEGLFTKDASYFGSGGHLTIRTDESNNLMVRLQSTTEEYIVNSLAPLAADTWQQVAFTFGTEGMKLYLNGQLQQSNPYTGGLGDSSGGAGNSEPIALGANNWASGSGDVAPLREYYSGLMDEVAVFGDALEAEEVLELHQIATVPEPSVMAILAAGGALLSSRRKR